MAFRISSTGRTTVSLRKLSFCTSFDYFVRIHTELLTQAIAHAANWVDEVIAKAHVFLMGLVSRTLHLLVAGLLAN